VVFSLFNFVWLHEREFDLGASQGSLPFPKCSGCGRSGLVALAPWESSPVAGLSSALAAFFARFVVYKGVFWPRILSPHTALTAEDWSPYFSFFTNLFVACSRPVTFDF